MDKNRCCRRYTLNDGFTFEQLRAGVAGAARLSLNRKSPFSVTERLKLERETPVDGMVRALMQELFSTDEIHKDYPETEKVIRSNLTYRGFYEKNREAFEENHSYQGLRSVLTMNLGEIIFTPEMPVPIKVDENSTPQSLFEYIHQHGFVNVFSWEIIKSS